MRIPGIFSLVKVLSRIADALDRAYPKDAPRRAPVRPSTLADLTTYDAEADYFAELEQERLRELGEASEVSDV